MTDQSSKLRLLSRPKIAGIAALAAVAVFFIGYRLWAYNGWMEYRLICLYGNSGYIEISSPPTPALQDAIEEHYNILTSSWAGNHRPFYRENERFYMRPWYYLHHLGVSTKSTFQITNRALGAGLVESYSDGLGGSYCTTLFDNPNLFSPPTSRVDPTANIYSQDYLRFLSIIAPPPERN